MCPTVNNQPTAIQPVITAASKPDHAWQWFDHPWRPTDVKPQAMLGSILDHLHVEMDRLQAQVRFMLPQTPSTDDPNHYRARQVQLLIERLNASIRELADLQQDSTSLTEPCSIAQVLASVASFMRPKAIERSIHFEVVFDDPVPHQFPGDPVRLERLLCHLISQAIDQISQGQVLLRVSYHALSKTPGAKLNLRIETVLNNHSFPSTTIPSPLPEPPKTPETPETPEAPEAPDQASPGSDLLQPLISGPEMELAIAGAMAKKIGAELAMEELPQNGRRWTLSLLLPPAALGTLIHAPQITQASLSDAAIPILEQSLKNRRILVVDDNLDSRRLLGRLIERAGGLVSFAEDGVEGLAAVQIAMSRQQPYDLVLMDMHMPVVDGFEAVTRLREHGYTLPILAMTATEDIEDRCRQVGCNDRITKPIHPVSFINTLAQYLLH